MRYNLKGVISSDEDAPIYRFFGMAAVSPADIRQAIADTPAGEDFVLEINSGGGSVYAGFEMYSILRAANVPTRAEVQSLAGSAASVVMAGADTVAASPVGQVMIHLPSTFTEGNQVAHRESVQMLEAVTGSILAAYERKCGGRTSREALDAGLVDEILGETGSANPMNVWNAAGGAPDIEKLRAAYREAVSKLNTGNTDNTDNKQARARAIALAEAELY